MIQCSKILIAFLMVVILSSCASVDQTLYKVSDGISSIDRVTGKRTANLTPRKDQISQSNNIATKIIDSEYASKGLPINEKIDAGLFARLQKIFKRVHSVSHMSDENWDVYLVPDDEFNAFVTGGTYVVVNEGLMKEVQSDDELAAILGHEIAHVSANHLYESKAHALAGLATGSKSVKRNSFKSAFTHKHEEEADAVGILYATLAGYDPYAASKIWKRMYENKGNFSAMMVDHPIYSERYQKAGKLADLYAQYYTPGKINTDYQIILQNNEVFGPGPEDMSAPKPGQGAGVLSVIEAVAEGMGKHYEAKAEEARQQIRVMKIKRVSDSLSYVDKKISDSHTMKLSIKYHGYEVLKNLTFISFLGDEEVTQKIDSDIYPGNTFDLILTFKKDLNERMTSNDPFGVLVSHVD